MNKTVLITGASKGIGRETAIYFAKHNYNVVINYLTNEKEALKLKAIIEKNYNVSSMIIKADVSNEIEVKNMLDKVIKESYDLLGLMSFLTAGKPEVRAWTIKKGTKAPEAAGKIHSDIQRGFIRAEVVSYDDLIKLGSLNEAKEKGLVRSEGKDYIMQDGDVVLFRVNV